MCNYLIMKISLKMSFREIYLYLTMLCNAPSTVYKYANAPTTAYEYSNAPTTAYKYSNAPTTAYEYATTYLLGF